MSQKQRILHCLANACGKYGGWVSFTTLNKIGYRYGGRIHEMGKKGIKIENKTEGRHEYYRLVTAPTEIDFEKCRLEPIASVKPGETMELRL